jgi:hypothetical protein
MAFKGPQQIITNGDMSGNLTSEVTVLDLLVMISYSITWVGASPTGVVTVQVSDDYAMNSDGSVRNSGTWTDVPLSDSTNVAGNTGHGIIDLTGISSYAIRLIYTATSGTGLMQVFVMGK